MENNISNLKNCFQKIIDANTFIISIFDNLDVKISNITTYYVELIEKNKDKMYLFGLDSFRFQISLLDRERNETKSFFKAVHNRIYSEYYKFCKKICEYISETHQGTNLINIAKTINEAELPVYDSVDPEKEYNFCFVLTIHDNIVELLKSLYGYLLNKDHELKSHKIKKTMGLNIDNFIFTFSYNNAILRDKLQMFLDYMNFFHNMHLKNLNLIKKKLILMTSEINNELNLDDDFEEDTTETSSVFSSESKINKNLDKGINKKREKSNKKNNNNNNESSQINVFFKKKENESVYSYKGIDVVSSRKNKANIVSNNNLDSNENPHSNDNSESNKNLASNENLDSNENPYSNENLDFNENIKIGVEENTNK